MDENNAFGILNVRFQMLESNLLEVKQSFKRYEDIQSSIRVLELKHDRQSSDFEKIMETVRILNQSIIDGQDKLDLSINKLNEALTEKIKEVKVTSDNIGVDWKEKYNMGRGVIIAMSLFSTVVTIVFTIFITHVDKELDKVNEVYNWYYEMNKNKIKIP
jgi:hypothetical protein